MVMNQDGREQSDPYLVGSYTDNITYNAHQGQLIFICRKSNRVTVSRMQTDKFVAEGPTRYTLNVGLPVLCRASQWWPREFCQWMKVDVVDDNVQGVGGNRCEGSGYQDADSPILESLHCI